jgi:RNA polymerase sigma-70 factor (ECF subfamily)
MPSDLSALDPPDRDLLARAAAGEPDAFGSVYQAYQHIVFRFGLAMTGSLETAEDIRQDVFVTLFRNLERYDPARASFTTYLYGIVRNMSRAQVRRERRFIPLELASLGARDRTDDTPFDTINDAQSAARARKALRQLPSTDRTLVVLCDLHGLRYADAARIVNLSIPAVRSRLHRARRQLRHHWIAMCDL